MALSLLSDLRTNVFDSKNITFEVCHAYDRCSDAT